MPEDKSHWCCINKECKKMNSIDESIVKLAEERKKPLLMPCGYCGYVYQFVERDTEKSGNWLKCLPFRGMEKRLPIGDDGVGNYKDPLNKILSVEGYINEYGVDPEKYLTWVRSRKPKSKQTCP